MKSEIVYYVEYYSSIGKYEIVSNVEGTEIIGLWLENQKYNGREKYIFIKNKNTEILIKAKNKLKDYFNGANIDYSNIKLNPRGTQFQKIVWSNLMSVGYGSTSTYKEIAKKVAKDLKVSSMSSQAVGGAISKNPISIFIPCHRILSTKGELTGYAGGLDTKKYLLSLEGNN